MSLPNRTVSIRPNIKGATYGSHVTGLDASYYF
ncbi:hypothetical protein BPODLACK_00769 [Gordonia sp. YY1]|nr:hypothetical protein BPODLACK_00769 [Gordonia sp. YY1]